MMESAIVKQFQTLSSPVLDFLMKGITLMGEAFFLVFVFLIFYYAINKDFALDFILSATIISLFNYGLKIWIKRPRPYAQSVDILKKSYSSGFSFASGHSVCSASIASGVVVANKKHKKRLFWLVPLMSLYALLVGISRIYLGHHFLTDVITGLFLGAIFVPFFMNFLEKLNVEKWICLGLFILGLLGACVFCQSLFVSLKNTNALMACGGVCGLGIGMFLERVYVNFEIKELGNKKHVWWNCALSILNCFAVFIVLKLLTNKLGILVFLTYFIVGFYATFVEMFFLKARLKGIENYIKKRKGN